MKEEVNSKLNGNVFLRALVEYKYLLELLAEGDDKETLANLNQLFSEQILQFLDVPYELLQAAIAANTSYGYGKLFNAIFGVFGKNSTLAELQKEFGMWAAEVKIEGNVKFNNLIQPFNDQVIRKIVTGHWSIIVTESDHKVFDDVFETLTSREEKVIRMRFGINAKPMTLDDVGLHFAVTRERIRQIEAKAMRKLRHPSRSKQLKKLFTNTLSEQYGMVVQASIALENEVVELKQRISDAEQELSLTPLVQELNAKLKASVESKERLRVRLSVHEECVTDDSVLSRSVDELTLSRRTYYCLKNADIRSIGDLTKLTEREMLNKKNFGRKSLAEVRDLLAGFGLRFKPEEE